MTQLVLSLFPGIGLLDMAFEEEGFCVVRGPDLLWGGDIRRFHPPAGKFDGVIGGPPCQAFSRLRHLVENNGHSMRFGNLIPEFERVVCESEANWFLMENVPEAPLPCVHEYSITDSMLNNRWVGGIQNRSRRFSFGLRHSQGRTLAVEQDALESLDWAHAVCGDARAVPVAMLAGGKPKSPIMGRFSVSNGARVRGEVKAVMMSVAAMCELQGLAADFADDMPFTVTGKRKALGNGVPLPMGRAVAKAVKRALGIPEAQP